MSCMNLKDCRESTREKVRSTKHKGRGRTIGLEARRKRYEVRNIKVEGELTVLKLVARHSLLKIKLRFLPYQFTKYCCARNTAAPARYPSNAIQPIFFKYQKKSIFSSPIAATPAAEPMIRILPPVPAQYAKNSQ